MAKITGQVCAPGETEQGAMSDHDDLPDVSAPPEDGEVRAGRDKLLDLAKAYHSSAEFSTDPITVAIARLLDAAWLMRWRRDHATGEPDEAAELQRAVAKYLSTRAVGEHWALAALSPLPGDERAEAIRKLRDIAESAIADIRQARAVDRERAAELRATVLLARVEQHGIGLAVDRVDRKSRTGSRQTPWRKLLDELLHRRPDVERVVALALQCRGVSSDRARKWARATNDRAVK